LAIESARAINTEPDCSRNQHQAENRGKTGGSQGGIKALTRENISLSEVYGD
jgi:hypothetical protein